MERPWGTPQSTLPRDDKHPSMSMNVKSPSPPFIFFVKNATLPQEAVKFIVTHPFLLTNMVCGWIAQ